MYSPLHPSETRKNRLHFKNLAADSEKQLEKLGLKQNERTELLSPAKELLDNSEFWSEWKGGLSLFISPSESRRYIIPIEVEPLNIVNERFHLKPLLPAYMEDYQYYLLTLSLGDVKLYKGTLFNLQELSLENSDIPKDISAFLKYDDPESQLQYHTGTPSGPSNRSAVYHGQGVGKDETKTNILRFFQSVDRGFNDYIKDKNLPLLIAGLDHLSSIYSEANSYPPLLHKTIKGNPETMNTEELHKQAKGFMQENLEKARKEAADKFNRFSGSDRASHDLNSIVPAAFHARIEILLAASDTSIWGKYLAEEEKLIIHEKQEPGDEDLVDLASVRTFLTGGKVHLIKSSQMPADSPVAAVYRF